MRFPMLLGGLLLACSTQALAAKPITFYFYGRVPQLVNSLPNDIDVVKRFDFGQERSDILRKTGKATESVQTDLQRFAQAINRNNASTRFVWDGSYWKLVQTNAWKVDIDKTLANFNAVIKDPNRGQVDIVYSQTLPKLTLQDFVKRGITAKIGEGITNYFGSSEARIHNVHTAASRFQDVLFEGKTFSFNKILGPVEESTGFVEGLIIAGDRTEKGVGGGVCQVSSTVFRALYSAGLPIVERRPHSYQVGYYRPAGYDATVFYNSQDLRMTNDTGGALWFQTDWNDATRTLTTRVFGKPLAYTVDVSVPKTLSTLPSPPDRTIIDPTLKPGERKQVDHAVEGATIEVYRTLKDASGKVLRSDTLRSVYKPWPNIFTVGPEVRSDLMEGLPSGAVATTPPSTSGSSTPNSAAASLPKLQVTPIPSKPAPSTPKP